MFSKKRIALIGANGFVGTELRKILKSSQLALVDCFVRGEQPNTQHIKYDFVINASNPAKRFFANTNPASDFEETVIKTEKMLALFPKSKMILVSSLSCRTQPYTHYGAHRLLAEEMVLASGGSVARLGPMFGGTLRNSVLQDIIHSRPVYISKETRYGYAHVEWVARYLIDHLDDLQEVQEITSRNAISLEEVADYFNSKSEFIGDNDDQFNSHFSDGPDAYEVLNPKTTH